MENTAVLNIRISEQLKQKLEELAKEKNETVSLQNVRQLKYFLLPIIKLRHNSGAVGVIYHIVIK